MGYTLEEGGQTSQWMVERQSAMEDEVRASSESCGFPINLISDNLNKRLEKLNGKKGKKRERVWWIGDDEEKKHEGFGEESREELTEIWEGRYFCRERERERYKKITTIH